MYYAPHQLQIRSITTTLDSYGRIVTTSTETWTTVCQCRCDDNTIQEFKDENGKVFRPKYHIVADGHASVEAGDEVRVLRQDGTVRARGTVYNVKQLNVLQYTDVWV